MINIIRLTKIIGFRKLFYEINLTLDRPGIVYICGPNGSGKTTLLSMMSGALRPDAGDILVIGGSLVYAHSVAVKEVSYVPDGSPVYPFITGREWLDFVGSLRKYNLDERNYLVKKFNLEPFLGTRFGEMSLGTSKKFLITAALMCETPVTVMDEPTNGLDDEAFTVLKDRLEKRRDVNLFVISCHNQGQRAEIGGREIDLRRLTAN